MIDILNTATVLLLCRIICLIIGILTEVFRIKWPWCLQLTLKYCVCATLFHVCVILYHYNPSKQAQNQTVVMPIRCSRSQNRKSEWLGTCIVSNEQGVAQKIFFFRSSEILPNWCWVFSLPLFLSIWNVDLSCTLDRKIYISNPPLQLYLAMWLTFGHKYKSSNVWDF